MSSGIDFGVHCESCFGVDVKLEDLWVDRDGQRWATCRSCYQSEHDQALVRMRAAEAKLAAIQELANAALTQAADPIADGMAVVHIAGILNSKGEPTT